MLTSLNCCLQTHYSEVGCISQPLSVQFRIFIILSVAIYSLETVYLERYPKFFFYAEIAIVAIFTTEYIARILAKGGGVRYIVSFYGIIDFLAILPFYLMLYQVDLRSLRILRLLRFFRIFKLTKYFKAMERLKNAISDIKEELLVFMTLTIIIIYLSAVGIYHFEHNIQSNKFGNIFDCLWWSISTLTTVGYGDVYPLTMGGKIFTFIILIAGLGIVAIPSGLIAGSLFKDGR